MPPLWEPRSRELLISWVKAIMEEASDDLTDWENKFVTDMKSRLSRGSTLTQSQEEKLEQIYAEKTS